jgi:hypothetical protein
MIKKFKILSVLFLSLFLFFGSIFVQSVSASSDLTVDCLAGNNCSISPASTPLFFENNIMPGDAFVQRVRAENNSGENSTFAFSASNLRPSPFPTPDLLSDKIMITIRENTTNGPVVYGPMTLTDLIGSTSSPVLLSPVNSHAYRDFYFHAEFDPSAGNEYQGVASIFDLSFVFSMVPAGDNPSDPPSSPSPASPTECTDEVPSSAPILYWIESNTDDGEVTLGWNSVSPADHYAINFGTQAGVYLYGNNNVGNQISYTVTGLTPGYQYFFQVLGVNGCMPGPRSNEIATSGFYAGGAIVPAPEGFTEGGVLGEATESAELATPAVAGATDSCSSIKFFVPWVILLIQFILIMILEYFGGHTADKKKYILPILVTGLAIILFYLFKNCNCYDLSFLALLCKWYWVVSILLTVIGRVLGYAFLEDAE